MLVQVTSNHFCAGIILENDIVIEAAPILNWTIGKNGNYLRDYFKRKNWKAIQVN